MGFFALLTALLLEQMQPLARNNPAHRAVRAASVWIEANTNAGEVRHGAFGWLVLVGGTCATVLAAGWLLAQVHWLAAFVLHVAVLYYTVGFRHFSRSFADIQVALTAGDVEGARALLARWLREADAEFAVGSVPVNEMCRLAISHALLAAHRHVFGPLFWYVLLPGAVGPVLYRMSEHLARRWREQPVGAVGSGPMSAAHASEPYGRFAQHAYRAIDWLPMRLSAASFAVVGNFEDAVYCWRGARAVPALDQQRSILLGAGSGALGLRIADSRLEAAWVASETGFDWSGAEPDATSLRSAVGLVWRAVVLWVLVFALLTIASWLA